MLTPSPSDECHGTIVFLAVDGIKNMSGPVAYSCVVALTAAVGESSLVKRLGPAWLGTTASGLFLLVPDEMKMVPHSYLLGLFQAFAKLGLPIRCGVAWGSVLCFTDADDEMNFVGRAVNTAARLAYSSDNPGCLIHERYELFAKGFADSNALDSSLELPRVNIRGKEHDGAGYNCLALGLSQLPVLSEVNQDLLPPAIPTEYSSGLVFAYDLPHFSAGDESQLSKRVRSLVDAMRGLRQNREALRQAAMFFCPGGDGGLLVVNGVRAEALGLSGELLKRLAVESEHKTPVIAVHARLGIHYGVVALYRDGRGRLRPTGPTCFLVDELISDSHARDAGIVFSDTLADVISHGSKRVLENEFDELPQLTSGPAAGIVRYAPKRTTHVPFGHVLIDQLFGPTSSWQPGPH